MKALWSNLCGHYSVTVVLDALAAAGIGWSGENVGALRGAAWIGEWLAAAVANVRSADVVSADMVAISLRRSADLVAFGVNCHGSQAGGDLVLVWQSRGGGGTEARSAIGSQYITPATKFLHCHEPVLLAKKRKGAAA